MTCANCPHVIRVNATVTGCAIPRVTDRPCFDADVAADMRREIQADTYGTTREGTAYPNLGGFDA